MSLEAARARFEQRQVALFRDECTIKRLGMETFDSTTGLVTPGSTTTIYSGACLVRGTNWQGADVGVGETEVRMRMIRGKFPKDTPIEKDDIVTVTASTFDVSLIGRPLRVTDVPRDGWQIVRVAILEEMS